METVRSLESDLAYLKQLVGAGLNGIGSARHELDGNMFTSPLQAVVWTPTAIGATIGMLGTRLIANRKSLSSVAIGGLVGSVLGVGAALAWSSRRFTGLAARKAVRHVNAARDAHWLETNPIDYA
jgi:hypothetical protein